MATESQPFVGPRPFERADHKLFFGRGREADELLSLVIAHTVVLLYAPSGAGKTSLLNAKFIPLLEEEGLEVLNPARVQGQIPKDIDVEKIPNLYVFNILVSWDKAKPEPWKLAHLTLAEFLKERPHPLDREGMPSPRVVILDQFEELFTAYPERWKGRQEVFEQISDALEADHLLRVVFSIREDYIAELDPYASVLPGKLRTRFRLERLRERAALKAVTEPLRDTDRHFADGVAEQLVKNLMKVPIKTPDGVTEIMGEFIEPVQLQVVAQSLWQNLQSSQDKVITLDYLKAFGDVDQALSTFYERSIQQTVEATGIMEGVLRRWFERILITAAGTRGTVFRGAEDTGGLPNAAVDELEKQHLVRAELRGGARWYELTHDRLIETIRTSNQRWLLGRTGAEQTRQRLEAKATEWVRHGRRDTGLLDEVELLEAERWLKKPDAAQLGHSETLLALVEASRAAIEESANQRELAQAQALANEQRQRAEAERARAEEQQQRVLEQAKAAKRLRRLVAALAVMFLLAVTTAVFAWMKQREAAQVAERLMLAARVASKNREAAALLKSDFQGAVDKYYEGLQIFLQAGDLVNAADQLLFISRLYRNQKNDPETAEKLLKQAIKTVEPLGSKSLILADCLGDLATIYRTLNKFQEAEPLYARVLEVRENILGQENALVATSLNNQAVFYREWGEDAAKQMRPEEAKQAYGKAESPFKKALEIRRKILPPEHPEIATSIYGLAKLYLLMGRYQEAEPLFAEALEMRKKTLGPRHPIVGTTMSDYAKVLRALQRNDEAAIMEEEASKINVNQSN